MAVPVNEKSTTSQGVVKRRKEEKLIKLYVWELPVRIFHWINAVTIIILMITGIYIANPFFSPTAHTHATLSSVMGLIRNIHFFAGFVFTLNLLVRWYWVYKGNVHATSNLLKREFWVGVKETSKDYLFLKNKKQHYIGHNPLAQLSYWVFIGAGSLIAMFTGYFLLFEPQPHTWLAQIFAWVPAVFGGDSLSVRAVHHFVAWGFMIFMIIHIYMSFREDWLSKNGTMSSIFTGYKTEKEHEDK